MILKKIKNSIRKVRKKININLISTMPLPSKDGGENKSKFMSRCISNPKMKKEFSDIKQRIAVCLSQYGKTKNNK